MKFSSVLLITDIIICIKARLLNNRVTLRTLKVLNILTALNALTAFQPLPASDIIVISRMDRMTIHPSKIFILSLTYPIGLKAMSLIAISKMKIQVKISLNNCNKSNVSYSVNNPSNAKTTVLQITASVRKFSTNLPLTKN